MSEKTEKKTASYKFNSFLQKNRKGVIGTFITIIILLVAFLTGEIIYQSVSEKDLGKIEILYYELINVSDEDDVQAKTNECFENLLKFTNKKGIVGVRANFFAAEIKFMQKDYTAAIDYYDAAIKNGKKSYTAPICSFNKGVCYENLQKLDEALEAYKFAAEFEEYGMASHAYFSYGRILETQGKYQEAVDIYKTLSEKFTYDDWSDLAKTRIIELTVQGKAE